ncbi:MAG: hypothetical protein IKR77_05740 [Bacteroidales bacterium]|nr:hypothetical protein [Bacteroidales bacterium]
MDSDRLHSENPKDLIRKEIRDTNQIKTLQVEQNLEKNMFFSEFNQPIVDEFVSHFRAAGGKFFPFPKDQIYTNLELFLKKQKYQTVAALTPNLHHFLTKREIPFVQVVPYNEPADVALVFSDMLVACSGSIGFSPRTILYSSIKNIAKDVVVMTRSRCVFPNHAAAMVYQHSLGEQAHNAIVEFVTPELVTNEEGKPVYTPQNPRFFVFMVQDDVE